MKEAGQGHPHGLNPERNVASRFSHQDHSEWLTTQRPPSRGQSSVKVKEGRAQKGKEEGQRFRSGREMGQKSTKGRRKESRGGVHGIGGVCGEGEGENRREEKGKRVGEEEGQGRKKEEGREEPEAASTSLATLPWGPLRSCAVTHSRPLKQMTKLHSQAALVLITTDKRLLIFQLSN